MLRLLAFLSICYNVVGMRNITTAEFLALQALYIAGDGENWPWRFGSTITKWDFSTIDVSKPCGNEWEHVVCDPGCTEASEFCSVTTLSLHSVRFKGSIPSEMSDMKNLTTLYISGNNITSIHPDFWSSPALRTLDVSHNQITYNMDESICNAVSLVSADLTDNNFFGSIPDCISSLSTLNSLYLTNNNIDQAFPALAGLPFIFALYLENNRLKGSLPSVIAQMTTLGVLSMNANQMTGSLPTALGQMTQILNLMLNENKFTDEIPTAFCQMSSLQSLYLSSNRLSGTLPGCVGQMDQLNSLVLCHNNIEGQIPSGIADGGLRVLLLDYNAFSQTIPQEILAMPSLSEVDLSHNMLTGSLSQITAAKLSSLDLSFNRLQGRVEPVLAPSLQFVDFSSNLLEGSVEESFAAVEVLMSLNLGCNRFTGSFPTINYKSDVTLRDVLLRDNRFESTVPTWLVNFTAIVEIDVSENDFSGPVPENFFLWEAVTCANFSHNHFTGAIPSVFDTNCPEVVYFDVSHNQLSGPISGDLVAALNLFELIVNSNDLTGTIPVCLTNMQLYLLKLDNNYLTGTIPAEFAQVANLRTLFVYSNFLSGSIENVFSEENVHLSVVDFSDNAFSGTVPETVFRLPELKSISMAKNCFEGDFPVGICEAKGLVMLDFDGIRSGSACQRPEFVALSHVTGNRHVYFSPFVSGSIPQCLFELENITQIFISGNGLAGSIPEIPMNSKITDLALSFNRIRGSIPESVQTHTKMRSLHLSNNRLCGEVSGMTHYTRLQSNKRVADSIAITSTGVASDAVTAAESDSAPTFVGLQNNRLSGYLPQEFVHAENVNVLAGNLFMCDSVHALPQSDPSVDHYFCGSSVLDGALYTLLGYLVVVLFVVAIWTTFYYTQMSRGGARQRTVSDPLRSIRDTITMQYSGKHIRESTSVMLCRDDAQWAASQRSSMVEKASVVDPDTSSLSILKDVSAALGSNSNSNINSKEKVILGEDEGAASFGPERLSSISLGEYDSKCSEMHNLFGLLLTLRQFSIYAAFMAVGLFLPAYVVLKMDGSENSTHTYQYGWYCSMAYLQGEESAVTLCVLWSLLLVSVVVAVLLMHRPITDRSSVITSSSSSTAPESDSRDSETTAQAQCQTDAQSSSALSKSWTKQMRGCGLPGAGHGAELLCSAGGELWIRVYFIQFRRVVDLGGHYLPGGV